MASYPHPLEVDTRPIPQLTMRAGLGRLGADIVSLGIGHIEKQTGTEVPWALKTGLAAFWVSQTTFHIYLSKPVKPKN